MVHREVAEHAVPKLQAWRTDYWASGPTGLAVESEGRRNFLELPNFDASKWCEVLRTYKLP